jgi:hypothetical protein
MSTPQFTLQPTIEVEHLTFALGEDPITFQPSQVVEKLIKTIKCNSQASQQIAMV